MKINNISFPHPVLGIGDDVSSITGFATAPQVKTIDDNFVFITEIQLEDKNIKKYIEHGWAIYTCEVNCVPTLFRKCYQSSDKIFTIEIPVSLLAGIVKFQFFITAKQTFVYANDNFHPDYTSSEFTLDKGDILAYIGEFTYDIEIDYKNIRSIGSFMQIIRNDNLSSPCYKFDSEKILIQLPEKQFELYSENLCNNRNCASIIHASLVLNALIAALMNYNDF